MTIAEILATARNEIDALEPIPICSETHAAKLLREDALKIFDQMAAQIENATSENAPDYLTGEGVY